MLLKICGVQDIETAKNLSKAGVDMIGLNFVPVSTRRVTIQTAKDIVNSLKNDSVISRLDLLSKTSYNNPFQENKRTQVVGVFQDQELDTIRKIIAEVGLDYIQLHGNETPDYCKKIPLPIIKTFTVSENDSSESLLTNIANYTMDYVLLDRAIQGAGDGVPTSIASEIAKKHSVLMAGGITIDNIATIIKEVNPAGIDIASGVESNGIIVIQKVSAILEAIH